MNYLYYLIDLFYGFLNRYNCVKIFYLLVIVCWGYNIFCLVEYIGEGALFNEMEVILFSLVLFIISLTLYLLVLTFSILREIKEDFINHYHEKDDDDDDGDERCRCFKNKHY